MHEKQKYYLDLQADDLVRNRLFNRFKAGDKDPVFTAFNLSFCDPFTIFVLEDSLAFCPTADRRGKQAKRL